MEPELEEIEFLALSPNRVAVLQALADGPQTRSDLASATGASQATLGRILGDFEDRAWIERTDGGYRATVTGRLVARGFSDLLAILDTERDLRAIAQYLPGEAMDFDLRHLAGATVTLPTETRPNAPVQRLIDLEREGREVRAFSHAFNEQTLSLTVEQTAADEMDFRGVFSRGAIDALASDSDLRDRLGSLLAAENATVRICEGGVPIAGTVVDDTAHVLVRDDNGVVQGSIDTDDGTVHEWATETFARYWDEATPLRRDDLVS